MILPAEATRSRRTQRKVRISPRQQHPTSLCTDLAKGKLWWKTMSLRDEREVTSSQLRAQYQGPSVRLQQMHQKEYKTCKIWPPKRPWTLVWQP
jgi:hypothetical protein